MFLLNYIINVAMLAGVLLTFFYTVRHHGEEDESEFTDVDLIDEENKPLLCPAYGKIPEDIIARVSERVFAGELKFRRFILESQNQRSTSIPYHLSKVHAYRDIEIQAFIMSHFAQGTEIEIRSMWVYLAHWLDDMFDNYYAVKIADLDLEDNFDVAEVLGRLDPRFESLWKKAVEFSSNSNTPFNKDLLETGMRRMIIGGPMFSGRSENHHGKFRQMNHRIILGKLNVNHVVHSLLGSSSGNKNAIVSDRYLAYTAKVVVEI